MDKKKFVFTFLFYIFSIFILTEDTKAKSLNKEKFLKSYDKIEQEITNNKKFTKNNYDQLLNLNNKYDVFNLKIEKWTKGNFFFYLCDGSQKFEIYRENILVFCEQSDKIYTKHNLYKEKNMKEIEYYISGTLSLQYAWKYYYSKNHKHLKLSKKFIKKNLKLKNSKKYIWHYYAALKANSIINRSDLKYKDAIKNQRLILDLFKCDEDLINKIICHEELSNFAVLLMDTGTSINNEKANKILMRILNSENEKNFKEDNRRAVRVALYSYHMSNFNFEDAEKYISDSIQYINTLDKRGTEDYYGVLARLYNVQLLRGFTHEVTLSLEKTLKDIERDLGTNSVRLADILNMLLDIHTFTNPNKIKAKKIKDKLENILDQYKDDNLLDGHIFYASLGEYYLAHGEFKKGEKYLDKSNQIRNSVSITPSLVIAKTKVKKYDQAKKILDLYKPITTYDKVNFMNAKFIFNYETKNIEELKKIIAETYLYYSNYSKGIIREKGNPGIDFFKRKITGQLELLTNLNKNDLDEISKYFKKQLNKEFDSAIIEYIELSRSSKFNKRVQNLIDRSNNKIIEEDKRNLQDLMIQYENVPRQASTKKQRNENLKKLLKIKNKISIQSNLIKKKLNISYLSKFSNEISLKDIQKEIDNDQALISYYFTENIYVDGALIDNLNIIYIDNKNYLLKKIKIKDEKFKNNIIKLISSAKLNNKGKLGNFDFESSNRIYNLILKPFEKQISEKDKLIIIPHKSLNSLPFEVLLKDKIKNNSKQNYKKVNWLGKRFAISYYPSIYTFFNLKKIKLNNSSKMFLGLGNPSFKKNIKITSNKTNYSNLMLRGIANPNEIRKLNELPETELELKNIANIFKNNSKLYLGNEFNEENIKAINFNNYEYIVFATHAVVANMINNISEPGLILTPPKKSSVENDGILTVSEIEKLKLNANIVILSACNTASEDGSPNGEGMSGLTSAFFHAGTKSMLVTHWDVETNSAVQLTTGSFKNLDNSESLSKALQKTKISMMNNKDTAHPFYWAPYVLIGNL